jgi:hypothetical protein
MGKTLCSAVIALAVFAPWACAQIKPEKPDVLVVAMPEPSTPTVLAIDFLCVGALILLFRGRSTRTNR